MITNNELLKLNKEFNQQGVNVTMEELTPLHDEDFTKGWVICADNVIVANASLNYEEVRNKIIEFLGR